MADDIFKSILDVGKPPYKRTKVTWPQDTFENVVKKAQALEKRFKTSYRLGKEVLIDVINDNYILSINWAVYKDILLDAGLYYHVEKYNPNWLLEKQERVKKLSTYMLKGGPASDEFFYLIVGMESLFGFNYEGQDISTVELTRKWVQNKFKPKVNGSNVKYMEYYNEAIDQIINWKIGETPINFTAQQFCGQIPLTSTAGSAFDPGGARLKIQIDGEEYSVENNKFAKSCVLSTEEKLERLINNIKQQARVNVKVEVTPKVRLIISSDYNMFLKMKFLGLWLEDHFHGFKHGSIWQTSEQELEQWFQVARTDLWSFPIDQSNWDHHIDIDMVLSFFRRLLFYFESKQDIRFGELIIVTKSIIYGIENCDVICVEKYPDGTSKEIRIAYLAGILSGWFLTAFLNSICNLAEIAVANRICQEDLSTFKPHEYIYVTGDDQAGAFKYLCHGLLFWFNLVASGFEIHPHKNFISQKHNEYLRKYATKDGINGYPARLINKITTVYPGSRENYGPIEYSTNICNRWIMMAQRLRVDRQFMAKSMKRDLRHANIPKDIAKVFPYISSINGGPEALKPLNNYKVTVIPGQTVRKVTIEGVGYTEFVKSFGLDQERAMDKWALNSLNIKDTFKNKVIQEQGTPVIQTTNIKTIPFAIYNAKTIVDKPELIEGWIEQDIISPNSKVMNRIFPGLKGFEKRFNYIPKSWLYDYITNRITIPLPTDDMISKAGLALLSKKYQNSLYSAMFNKRKTADKWLGLTTYYKNNIIEYVREIPKLPKMFVL